MTEQEIVFEQYCKENNIPCKRINETTNEAGERRADFMVGNKDKVIFELTELQPNKEDIKHINQRKETGIRCGGTSNIGYRVHCVIGSKKKQIKKTSKLYGGLPAVIVISVTDETAMGLHIEPNNMKVGMYGKHVAVLSRSNGDLHRIHDKFGGRRSVSEGHNISISAVCGMLYKGGALSFNFYHNCYAEHQLNKEVFNTVDSAHWGIMSHDPQEVLYPEGITNWEEL